MTSNTPPKLNTTRLPPPSLFQGPPSRNASNISLPSVLLPGTGAVGIGAPSISQHPLHPNRPFPLLHQRSFLGSQNLHPDRLISPEDTLDPSSASGERGVAKQSPRPLSREASVRRLNTADTEQDRADALWTEMQSTLAEVELSAVNGNQVFGVEHASALEELRTAQLALAQAWARSEADELLEHQAQEGRGSMETGRTSAFGVAERTTAAGVGAGPSLLGKGSDKDGGAPGKGAEATTSLEEETEKDIALARKRREANDRYFSRVNGGVLDVVGRLEEVADRMRRVERESRSIWSESASASESLDSPATGRGPRKRSGTLESKRSTLSRGTGSQKTGSPNASASGG